MRTIALGVAGRQTARKCQERVAFISPTHGRINGGWCDSRDFPPSDSKNRHANDTGQCCLWGKFFTRHFELKSQQPTGSSYSPKLFPALQTHRPRDLHHRIYSSAPWVTRSSPTTSSPSGDTEAPRTDGEPRSHPQNWSQMYPWHPGYSVMTSSHGRGQRMVCTRNNLSEPNLAIYIRG